MSPAKDVFNPLKPAMVGESPGPVPVPAAPIPPTPVASANSPVSSEASSAPPQATVIVSEADAYIHERIQAQPKTLDEVLHRTQVAARDGVHRLSLPDYFEVLSYDCTQGHTCKHHNWRQFDVTFADGARLPRWEYDRTSRELIFRWVQKEKRVLDAHINLHDWSFVNARYFPDAPKHLFTANGGVEVGGDILMFLPVKQALAIRTAPGKRSHELLRGRVSPGGAPGRVLMGDPSNPLHYMPNVSAEEAEGELAPAAGTLEEGRDF